MLKAPSRFAPARMIDRLLSLARNTSAPFGGGPSRLINRSKGKPYFRLLLRRKNDPGFSLAGKTGSSEGMKLWRPWSSGRCFF
jgi:hypothetical protein